VRHIDFPEGEIAALDAAIAGQALGNDDALRLMTVPGVRVVTACTFVAALGDIRRSRAPASSSATSAWTPRSASRGPRRPGTDRSACKGSAPVRHVLVEAAWVPCATRSAADVLRQG
jgi:transposase